MFHHAHNASSILSLATCAIFAVSAAAHADNIRYVRSTGSNAAACTLAAPCKSLQRGINKTPAGGELQVLDSGDFGSNATIDKSMTISGNGHTVFLGAAITIDGAAAVVTLRGLVLNGGGATDRGIDIDDAAAVHVERCVVHGFTGIGVNLSNAATNLFVTDTTVRGNGSIGVNVNAANPTRLTIDNSRIEANGSIGLAIAGIEATITRTVISGNGNAGLLMAGGRANVTSTTVANNNSSGLMVTTSGRLTVESSVSRGNSQGLLVHIATATARISNSVFTDNGTGIVNNGTVLTRRNNTVSGNTTDLAGTALTVLGGI